MLSPDNPNWSRKISLAITTQITQEDINLLLTKQPCQVFTTCPSQMFLWKAISDSAMEPNARTILWKWTITSLLLRSLLNPIIYCWRVRKMRRAFLEVLHLQTWTGADPGFFFGGGAPFKNDVIDWWRKQILIQSTSCIRKPQVTSGGRGCVPPAPSP